MKKRYLIVGLLVLLFVLYTVLFNRSAAPIPEGTIRAFDTGGFVDSESLSDTNKLVAENNDFALYIDETTSYFYVQDKRTMEQWHSNPDGDPWESDPNHAITNSALDKQRSTLELSYFNDSGAVATINNYKYSIYHPESILNDEGLRTYSIKYTDTGFQVLYVIEDLEIDYLYFPKFLTPEVLETIEDRDVLEAIAYTGYDEERDLYEIVQYEEMSKLVKKRLYNTFYGEEGLGYTREQSIAENASYGYTDSFEKVRFEIGIEVSLTDSGVTTAILHDSIVEPSNVKLATVSLYPLFGTAIAALGDVEQEGYIVLPDGSGAVMNFNNGKSYQQPYVKRLYGEDLAILSYKMPEVQEKISIPLYGMVKENRGGFAAIITDGDAMATLHADVSGRIDSFNKVYPSFKFREVESVTLGSGYNQYGIDLWTEERVYSDFAVSYHFLDETASYIEIAKVYQEHLITKGLIDHDETNSTVLTTEFLGAFDKRSFILGIPYYSNRSMTTYDQATMILEQLQERGMTNMNVQYTGIMNGGLSTGVNDTFDLERSLGSRRDYNAFVDYLQEQDMAFYPTVSLMTTSEFDKMFDRFRYTSSRIDGSQSILFDYHLPSKLPYSETPYDGGKEDYVLSPRFLEDIYQDFANDFDQTSLAFPLLGSELGSDYTEHDITYKQDALRIQQSLLASIEEDMMLQNPLGFAYTEADYITDLPIETTLYAILDYQIPLIQLVLSGYVDYSSQSLNLSNTRSTEYNFLKVLETGSNVKYTLSYEDSRLLRETEYNYYLSTQYTNWMDQIDDTVTLLDEIGIHQGRLIGHEVLQNNVVQVTYSHGLTIILNYNLSPVTINGDTIDAVDYLIVGGE